MPKYGILPHMKLTKKVSNEQHDITALFVLNVLIVAAALLAGDGQSFFQSGTVYGFGLLFLALASVRAATLYKLFDPVLKKYIAMCAAGMIVFAGTQVFEIAIAAASGRTFMNMMHVTSLYVMAVLIMTWASANLLAEARLDTKFGPFTKHTAVGLAVLAASAWFAADVYLQNIDPAFRYDSRTMVLIALLIAIIAGFGLHGILAVKRKFTVLSGFAEYLGIAFMLMVLTGAVSMLEAVRSYAFFREGIHTTSYARYVLFYAALSFLFVAFGKMRKLGGIYSDLEDEMDAAG
jgi:hypothetical protein